MRKIRFKSASEAFEYKLKHGGHVLVKTAYVYWYDEEEAEHLRRDQVEDWETVKAEEKKWG